MANFPASTQFRFWAFTEASLDAARKAARVSVGENTKPQADEEPLLKRVRAPQLTLEKELELLQSKQVELKELLSKLNVPRDVLATSITLFKRFYVHNSAAVFDPDVMLRTAAFVGIKVDGCPYREVDPLTSALGKALALPSSEFTDHEMGFLVGIRFHLSVHHPFGPLRGLLMQLEKVLALDPAFASLRSGAPAAPPTAAPQSDGEDSDDADYGVPVFRRSDVYFTPSGSSAMVSLYTRATQAIMLSLLTDCCLLYTPGQIALAALCVASRGTTGAVSPLDVPVAPAVEDLVKVFASGQLRRAMAAGVDPSATDSAAGAGMGVAVLDNIAGAEALIVRAIQTA